MHELSIADSVVRIAARNAGERRVTKVELKVGYLRQVVPSSLEFGFGLVAEGTQVEGAELELEVVPAAVVCRACGAETELEQFPLHCGGCGGLDVEVIRGEELRVESLELEDEGALATSGGRRA
jgi:hydrogenase nickel incorporation protein HypA/HybF